MVDEKLYGTLNGFYDYYTKAVHHMKEMYQAVSLIQGPYALDHWLRLADSITETLLTEAEEYGLPINFALAPVVFMDDWIRYGFPYVKRWSEEYEEILLPLHLFSTVYTDMVNNPQVWTRIKLSDFVLEVAPEEITAYSNDWYLALIRKKPAAGEDQLAPFWELTNDMSSGHAAHTQQGFNLTDYLDNYTGTLDRMRKTYTDSFGVRTQLFVKACRIKNMSSHITVSGDLITKYKNMQISYAAEQPGGFLHLETQKAILVHTLISIPVITSTFVIV